MREKNRFGLLPSSEDGSALLSAGSGAAKSQVDDLRKAGESQKPDWQTLGKRIEVYQKEIPEDVSPTLPPPPRTNSGDLFKRLSDLSAGWADTLTFGLTSLVRQGLNYDDAVDYNSVAYGVGQRIGQVHSFAMVFAGGAGGVLGSVQRGLNGLGLVQGVVNGVQSLQAGNYQDAFLQLGTGLLMAGRGANICRLGRGAVWVNRTVMISTGIIGGKKSIEQIADGDWFGGAIGLFGAAASLYQASKACFVAGTPIKGEHGSKAIEEYRVGERVWSRSENDPSGLVELKEIEAVFVRLASVLHLHVGGQVIGTTGEHPFYAENRGWVAAQELSPEDRILSEDGRWLQVEEVYDTNEWQTVYNFTVADHHTYFVGDDRWSIWAHNACVYQAADSDGVVHYVGIADRGLTRTLGQRLRSATRRTGLPAQRIPGLSNLTAVEAEAVELTLINHHKRTIDGGDTY